ncbi:hypothetical protein GUJ93_ZPchr0003g17267 [Zizania palustris]|uniref:Carboxypeptidase n=2 Tax=Zizania palustris TaxID=103762 RepID=A0A8J5RT24_ZIZPA|nr:hypothetical protein GUJ93_ZPchr0003g17267 [Zizania palustris]
MARQMETRALALLCLALLRGVSAISGGTDDGAERWGYVQVRPKAHLFWWYYRSPQRVSSPGKPWPTVLWLQGGPGSSGVGLGNFLEVGPLDGSLKPRNSTWLQKADLIFVDNPVGTGYSYVEDDALLVTTDGEAAADLATLLRELVTKELPTLQSSPLFLVAESYGGKYAATLGVSLARAVRAGELKLTLGGVALGDSWISPEDFALSYGPLLLQVSRLDSNGADNASKKAQVIRQHIAARQFKLAQYALSSMLTSIVANSGHVDVYNFLLDTGMDPVAVPAMTLPPAYSAYLGSKAAKASVGDSIRDIMNGAIKQKLKIIPKDVVWEEQSYTVYNALINDFMKPRIQEVDELLSYGVDVTVYNGQVTDIQNVIIDLIVQYLIEVTS